MLFIVLQFLHAFLYNFEKYSSFQFSRNFNC